MLHTLQKLANFTKPDIVERESPDFEIMAITEVSPYMQTFFREDIKKGVYEQLNTLQGKNRMWWVAPAFNTHIFYKQWAWTEEKILPQLLKD